MVPVRRPPVLTPTVYVTVPLPVPILPPLTRIQGALVVALHLQSGAFALTERLLPVTPADSTAMLLGETFSEQTTPVWLTVRLVPAIQIFPVREAEAGFGLMV